MFILGNNEFHFAIHSFSNMPAYFKGQEISNA